MWLWIERLWSEVSHPGSQAAALVVLIVGVHGVTAARPQTAVGQRPSIEGRVVDSATRDEVLAYIAAGPLENLLCRHPHAFIDRVEILATRDAHFRRALSGVWGWERMPDDVLARLDVLFGDEPRL